VIGLETGRKSSEDRSTTSIAAPIPNARFTIDGSPELEEQIWKLCRAARTAVCEAITPHALEGMMLGGGYGRGEGGVLRTSQGDLPYNDLEFYVFLRGFSFLAERKYQPVLHDCAHELTRKYPLDVEFRVSSLPRLRRSPPSMFFYDLMRGHRWLIGDENLLRGFDHHGREELIPIAEATRLLMNRCSGLLLAKERLQRNAFTADDSDFVGRNVAKAKLALGDALLVTHQQYHWSCRERHKRLLTLPIQPGKPAWLPHIQSAHKQGVEFKLHPVLDRSSREDLHAAFAQISDLAREVWLWLESRRLGKAFPDVRTYAFCSNDKCPESPAAHAILSNARRGYINPFSDGMERHPRNRILCSLPLLLWGEHPPSPEDLKCIQKNLGETAETFNGWVAAYSSVWQKVS